VWQDASLPNGTGKRLLKRKDRTMKINIDEFAIQLSDGTIGVEATCQKFRLALLAHIAEQDKRDDEVSSAVNGVFDHYRGARINMPALVSAALTRMNVHPENYKTLEGAVLTHIRRNPNVFRVSKGKGGGVSRIADE